MEFLYFFKKLLSYLAMPLSIVLILLLCSIYFYYKQSRYTKHTLITATGLLFVTSFPPIADNLIESLEDDYLPYQKITNAPLNYIVVLGCYHFSDSRLPATMELKTCSLERLVEAIRLANMHPEAQLIMSGGAGHNPESNAEKMKEAAMLMGIAERRIFTQNFVRNTEEEAQLIAPRVKGSRFALITNADHMRRSVNYFTAQGATPIAAPASYFVKGDVNVNGFDWMYFTPKVNSLNKTTVYWYETLGLTVQWFKAIFSTTDDNEANTTKNNR